MVSRSGHLNTRSCKGKTGQPEQYPCECDNEQYPGVRADFHLYTEAIYDSQIPANRLLVKHAVYPGLAWQL